MPVDRFRRRPEYADAVQFNGTNVAELADLLGWEEDGDYEGDYTSVAIEAPHGELEVGVGDWIVNSADGVDVLAPGEFTDMFQACHGCRAED